MTILPFTVLATSRAVGYPIIQFCRLKNNFVFTISIRRIKIEKLFINITCMSYFFNAFRNDMAPYTLGCGPTYFKKMEW